MAFKDLRNSLIISYDDDFIDDEEVVLLYDLYSSKDLDFPYDAYAPFDLEELDEAECVAEFRFRKRRTSFGRHSTGSRYHDLRARFCLYRH